MASISLDKLLQYKQLIFLDLKTAENLYWIMKAVFYKRKHATAMKQTSDNCFNFLSGKGCANISIQVWKLSPLRVIIGMWLFLKQITDNCYLQLKEYIV